MSPFSGPSADVEASPDAQALRALRERLSRKASATHNRLISVDERPSAWRELCSKPLDVAILGGGITGAGVALEVARQGRSVALFDARDFASGTSSRSSKLIHGGFRYLAQLEFGLVRKTALERAKLRQIAPHLTVPRWMVIPLASWSKHAFYQAAVRTYEALGSLDPSDRASRALQGENLLDREPAIDRSLFQRAVAFREYQTDDARLVLANLRAARGHGATPMNHAKVIGLRYAHGFHHIRIECALTSEQYEVRAQRLVNAAGPWVEELQRMENPLAAPMLHLSKGIHIALSADRVPIRDGVVLRANDRRYLFALRRGAIVYVGPTDTSFGSKASWWPEIYQRDVQYLLDAVNATLDIPRVTHADVVSAWAGLRPLIADSSKETPSELSRREELIIGPTGMISVAGGKLTGYREMARSVLQALIDQGCPLRVELRPPSPLPGGDLPGAASDLVAEMNALRLDDERHERLVSLYGSEAPAIAECGIPTHPNGRAMDIEVDWAVRVEGAATLEDLVYRRLRLPWFELDASDELPPLARRMGSLLEWSAERQERELLQLRSRLSTERMFRGAPS